MTSTDGRSGKNSNGGQDGRSSFHRAPFNLQKWMNDRFTVSGLRSDPARSGHQRRVSYATEQAFAGRWFHTGDIGVMDEDGYMFIVDRLNAMPHA